MGNEATRFAQALTAIEAWQGVQVAARSRLYQTEPQGDSAQPWFTNQVAELACASFLAPQELLTAMLCLEKDLGRTRDAVRRFGPRSIDLDLLLFGDMVCAGRTLCIPHPRMTERAFVLVPLLEIAPSLQLPNGESVVSCLDKLQFRVKGARIFQDTHKNP